MNVNSTDSHLTRAWGVAILIAVVCVFANKAPAAFSLFDDFNSYNSGSPLSGQGSWVLGAPATLAPAGLVSVTNVPTANIVGFFPTAGQGFANSVNNTYRPLNVPDANAGATIFWQFRVTGLSNNWNFALSDVAAPTGNSTDNEVQFNFDSSARIGSTSTFRGRSAGAFKFLTTDGTANTPIPVVANTTYNVWFEIDNTADRYRIYLQNDDVGLIASRTQMLASDGTGGLFTFRNSGAGTVANDLLNINMGTGGATQGDPSFVDNIYSDLSGFNSLNPVPEPSALALALCGFGALISFRAMRGRRA